MTVGLKRIPKVWLRAALVCLIATGSMLGQHRASQFRRPDRRTPVRAVTIPLTLRLREPKQQNELQSIEFLSILEDGEEQEILSLRGGVRAPLSLAILIQDDVVSSIANEINDLRTFIRRLPQGTRVFIGYLRAGSLQVRQRFTTDLDRAAKALRIPISSTAVTPFNPFELTVEALKRFESQPHGRRAVLLISDGVDLSRGADSSSPAQSLDLQRAINEAQRRSVAVHSFYAPTVGGATSGSALTFVNGQGALHRLSSETGGRDFAQGTGAPVSFSPYLRELNLLLSRQFALTYLSNHPKKGFHRIKVVSDVTDGEILHPSGYTR